MNPSEIYNLKRKNFIEKSSSYFHFLKTNHGYEKPIYIQNEYSDVIKYVNTKNNRIISLSNAYHPIDYGFELNIINTSQKNKNINSEMVYYKLKENQDYHQDYLIEASNYLKDNHESCIKGVEWFYNESEELHKQKFEIKILNPKKDLITKIKDFFK